MFEHLPRLATRWRVTRVSFFEIFFFRRIELYIKNGYSTPRLESAVEIDLPFLQRVESGFIGRVETANTAFTLAGGKVTTMQAVLTRLNYLKNQVQGGGK